MCVSSTETAGDVSCSTLDDMYMPQQTSTTQLFASIGYPISGVKFHIVPIRRSASSLVEQHYGCCDANESEGELIVTGIGLSLGYYNVDAIDEGQQQRQEKEHIFLNESDCLAMLGESHERAYRTGDIVLKGKNGLYFWTGRVGSQVCAVVVISSPKTLIVME